MEESLFMLWLSRIDSIGVKKQRALLNFFDNAKEVYRASKEELIKVPGLTMHNVRNILLTKDPNIIKSYYQELKDKKIKFISLVSKKYPDLLKHTDNAPIGLYMIGTMPDHSLKKIAIIGARRCSEYGLSCAYKLSKDLAKNNVVIVSGMARGIDAMAHKAALDAKGKTIAVVASGVDICYPRENINIYNKIKESSCIISEYPPSLRPIPGYFPVRNRIISGMCDAVLVVEAEESSGTLITADQALDQGRLVMAVPGNMTSKFSKGTNNLIKMGAIPITNYKDVLDHFGIFKEEDEKDKPLDNLTKDEEVVYNHISLEPINLDQLVYKCNAKTENIMYILTILEIKKYIQVLPGMRYIRIL